MSALDTPMFRQYRELKEQHPDCLLFFRMGDFYELFGEDAVWTAEALEITLTSRNRDQPDAVPMCGVPYHAGEGYLRRLVELGRKVAIAEQTGPDETRKGLMRREVVRVVTPGLSGDQADAHEPNWLAAVCYSGGYAFGLLDVSTGDVRVAELDGLGAVHGELVRHGPRELLLGPGAALELKNLVPGLCVSEVGASELDRAVLVSHFGEPALAGLGPGLHVLSLLLEYARSNLRSGLSNLVALTRYTPGGALEIDEATRVNLELFRPLRGGGRKGSLLGLLDHTRTAMGARLLREWLSAPLTELAMIRQRHTQVALLAERNDLRASLRSALAEVADLERLSARVSQNTASARDLRALCLSLTQVPRLAEALAETPTLRADVGVGPGGEDQLQDVAEEIGAWIVAEPPLALNEGGLLAAGVDAELDRLRGLVYEGKGAIARMEAALKAETGISSLKIRHNGNFGYYIEITKANLDRVPPTWHRKQTVVTGERFITPELKEYEEQVAGAEERCQQIEYQRFVELRGRIGVAVPRLQALARGLARLDVLVTFAEISVERRFVCPEIDESDELDVRGGRHPVVEAQNKNERFVPNDLRLDRRHPMALLTGPNMAGKSTLMRQVAQIVILAQMGCFVPATSARIGLCDRVFVRVGASDDVSRGQSTFMVEMRETANILAQASRRSLVLLDEIGRGTSTYDGLAIAWAVAEDLHDRVAARVVFATHYHELAALRESCGRVKNLQMAVTETGENVVFLRRVKEGAASSSYGIQCARLAGMPLMVVQRARGLLGELERRRPRPEPTQLSLFGAPPEAVSAPPPPTLDSPVLAALEALDPDGLSPKQALEAIYRLRRLLDGHIVEGP